MKCTLFHLCIHSQVYLNMYISKILYSNSISKKILLQLKPKSFYEIETGEIRV